jgi:hypothetical protein
MTRPAIDYASRAWLGVLAPELRAMLPAVATMPATTLKDTA